MVEFEFGSVQFPLFGLDVDLNENAIVETWIKILKVTLDNRESSGSTIQFSLRTCL